jgi:hypothetical protein
MVAGGKSEPKRAGMSDMRLSCRDATNRGPDYEREAVTIYGQGWLHHDKTDAYRTFRRVTVLTAAKLYSRTLR